MKRGLLALFVFLLFGLATSVAGAQRGGQAVENVPPSVAGTCGGLLCTPVPPSGRNPAHPGDEDGDGIPDGIDQCPNQGGPSSNQGCPLGIVPFAFPTATPTIAPLQVNPNQCVLWTGATAVNVRAEPSTSAPIAWVLIPHTYGVTVTSRLENAEGVWDRIYPGWVSQNVVHLQGPCDQLPFVHVPGAVDVSPLTLAFPDGFALTLDTGDSPAATETPQGNCAPSFAIDWPSFDGSGKDGVGFDFGDGSRCITLHSDGHGFDLWPPNPCDAALGCANVPTHWWVGFSPDNPNQVLLIGLLTPPPQPNSPPSDPQKSDVLLTWTFPSGPGTHNFTISWAQENPNENQPGLKIRWALENANENQPSLTISWALENANENQPGLKISWALENANENQPGVQPNQGLSNPPDPDFQGLSNPPDPDFQGLSNPPDPDFQGFGITGVPDVKANVEVNFTIPAVQ